MPWHPAAAAHRLLQGERGTIRKEWGGRLPIALAFPNAYRLGMSSLAVHTLYRLWNDRDDLLCERVFTDWLPPSSLESGATLDRFPIVAFTLSYELDYVQVVSLLRSAGIAPRAADRDETAPLILAGGPAVSANPEPLAPLLDAVVIGEVEPILDPLTDALHRIASGRDACLAALAELPGLYLPNHPAGGRRPVHRQWLRDLDSSPTHSALFTPHTEFANRGLIEISRGCGRGCRFCLAGSAYRPPRHRSAEALIDQARGLLQHSQQLGLISAAVSDHPEIDRIAAELRRLGARLSVSSLRVDPLSEALLRALAESGARTLTIAPEAGSDRLRRAIHKTQTEADVLQAVDRAARHGLTHLKLYFMVGLPTEEPADLQALVDLALACAARFRRQVTVNLTPFVPKAHTPFQRMGQLPSDEVKARLTSVENRLHQGGISVKSESPAWAEVQGALARGDRRLAEALLAVERLTPATWRQALAKAGLSAEALLAPIPAPAPLPWDFLRYGSGPQRDEGDAA